VRLELDVPTRLLDATDWLGVPGTADAGTTRVSYIGSVDADEPPAAVSGISGVSEDELHEIDAKIAQRRRDTDFMDRLHGRHDAERRLYERLAD
jgi:hypothetical protein